MGPRSTRNRFILEFDESTPLLVDATVDDQSRQDYTTSRLLYVRHVSSGRRLETAGSTVCSLELLFWSSSSSGIVDVPILKLQVHMPQSWTAKVYLAVLFVTMTTHSGISIKQQQLASTEESNIPFNSLNNVHSFFACDSDELRNILKCKNALTKVR
jgi:hypothetical protein